MEFVSFGDLSLSPEESRDIIEFIAQKRNVNNYKDKSNDELLSAIKEKSNNFTPKNQILTPEKPLKNQKRENNRILTSKNKERIDIIREELKDLSYKLPRSELKEIKKNLYNIEKRKQFE